MTFELTAKQALILWDVLARGGSAAQAEIAADVTPPDREALVKAGLLSTPKMGRSLWLTVEDAGWAWAADHLDAPLAVDTPRRRPAKAPARTPAPSKAPTLQLMLTHLRNFLRANSFALADFLPQTPPPKPVPKAERKPPTGKREKQTSAHAPKPPGQNRKPPLPATEKKIRAAVARLQGAPQRDGVRFSALREALPDVAAPHLDDALLRLFEAGKFTLMNLDNPRDIERERSAGIDYKGRLLQVIWVK